MRPPQAPAKIAAAGAVVAALIGVMAGAWARPSPVAAHPLFGPRQELVAADAAASPGQAR